MLSNKKKVKLGAGVLIYNDDSEILIQLRENTPGIKYPNCWVLFGGGIEPNELPIDAVTREIYEEIGVKLSNPEFFRTYLYEDEEEIHHQYIFKCKIDRSLRTFNIAEGSGFMLLSKADVDSIEFGFNIKQIVTDFYNEKTKQN